MNQVAPSTRKPMKLALSAIQKHKGQEAFDLLQQVLALNPNHAEALYHCGYLLHGSGKYAQATEYYQRAILADPNYIESYLMLCKIFQAQDRGHEAIRLAQHATQIAPLNPQTHAMLAQQLMNFNQSHAVPDYLAQVLREIPATASLLQLYSFALKVNRRNEEANHVYQTFVREHHPSTAARILYETYLPRLYLSSNEIDAVRAEFKAALERFIAEKPSLNIDQLHFLPTFELAYHNRDNKELMLLCNKMLRTVSPSLNYVAPHCKAALLPRSGPIRIGFISCHMHHHPVGSCYRNVMLHLAKQPEFAVTLFNLANIHDDKMQAIADAGIPIVSLPKTIASAHETVARHTLDILIYPDIGMDATTHYMAMARLARYQCCLQGHPETTGIDTMDYFIGSRSYEPPHANENYTERLLCTDGIDTIFTRQTPPQRWLSREEIGLPLGKKLYVCPMAIQKFHPDFDGVLRDILARDPEAVLVLFNDFQQQAASDILQKRILAQCDASRVIFLGWQPLETLFSIMKTADAILDTIYFGGGTTSQYAFGFGLPIVTMPGRYSRGRFIYSYYTMMGITDAPIAADTEGFVELAVKLANDGSYKQSLCDQILANNHKLFESANYAPQIVQLMNDIMDQNLERYQR